MEEQGNPGNSECSKCASHQLGAKVPIAQESMATAHKNITYNKGYRKDTKGPEGK